MSGAGFGERTARYALVADDLKIKYFEVSRSPASSSLLNTELNKCTTIRYDRSRRARVMWKSRPLKLSLASSRDLPRKYLRRKGQARLGRHGAWACTDGTRRTHIAMPDLIVEHLLNLLPACLSALLPLLSLVLCSLKKLSALLT